MLRVLIFCSFLFFLHPARADFANQGAICSGFDIFYNLTVAEADFRLERSISFYVKLPLSQREDMIDAMGALGFGHDDRAIEGQIVFRKTGVIDLKWIRITMPAICDLVRRHSAFYDGWEASMPENARRRDVN